LSFFFVFLFLIHTRLTDSLSLRPKCVIDTLIPITSCHKYRSRDIDFIATIVPNALQLFPVLLKINASVRCAN